MRQLVLLALAPFLAAGGAEAQEGRQADVRIERLEVMTQDAGVSVRVTVYSDNDGSARNTALHLFLPVGARVTRVPPGCLPAPASAATAPARVDCALGEIKVRDSREIVVITSMAAGAAPRRFAVFAFSDTPDPLMANNYAEKVVR
jgi:hypothetical protein